MTIARTSFFVSSLLAVASCGGGADSTSDAGHTRFVKGVAPRTATALVAIADDGRTWTTDVSPDGRFTLPIHTHRPVDVFVLDDGRAKVLVFPAHRGELAYVSRLPDYDGTVDVKTIASCDCDGDNVEAETTPEQNPLEQIDSDGDGIVDSDDTDTPCDSGCTDAACTPTDSCGAGGAPSGGADGTTCGAGGTPSGAGDSSCGAGGTSSGNDACGAGSGTPGTGGGGGSCDDGSCEGESGDEGSGDHGHGHHHKVWICHATGSATNPYVELHVSENALAAHRNHQNGQDIIPAPDGGCP